MKDETGRDEGVQMEQSTNNSSAVAEAITKLAAIGAGTMAGAIVKGAISEGLERQNVVVSTRSEQTKEEWESFGVKVADENCDAVKDADVVLIGVKPAQVTEVLGEIGSSLRDDAVVVSVAAGVSLDTMAQALPDGVAVVRVMPNSPALLRAGAASLTPGAHVDEKQMERVRALFGAVGTFVEVQEQYIEAVTAVSGSGPAYVYRLVEAMVDGGVLLGLTRDDATTLAVATAQGAALMLAESGVRPGELREQVTSPGGTTAAALAQMSRGGFESAVLDGMVACRDRSRELG